MGFFSDLKEDLSQAVNELMPEEFAAQTPVEESKETQAADELLAAMEQEMQATETASDDFAAELSLEEMLKNIDDIQLPDDADFTAQESVENAAVAAQEPAENWMYKEPVEELMEAIIEEPAVAAMPVQEPVVVEQKNEDKGAEEEMDSYSSRQAIDETAVITAGMQIKGDITSEGSVDVVGSVEGNIEVWGKLNVTGHINGNSKAAEIYAEGAKVTGEIVSAGAVKIGNSSVIIGNITAKSAAIAGAVKGDIDVQGPVVLDASAIVMGNIKSKSVQINNGAVIEGMCSQCYADVSPLSFFDEYKAEIKNSKKSK